MTPNERAMERLALAMQRNAQESRRISRRLARVEVRLGIVEGAIGDEDESDETSRISIDGRRGLRAAILPGWWQRNWRTVVLLAGVAFGGWGLGEKLKAFLAGPPPIPTLPGIPMGPKTLDDPGRGR